MAVAGVRGRHRGPGHVGGGAGVRRKVLGTTRVWMSMHALWPTFMIGPTSFADTTNRSKGGQRGRPQRLQRDEHVNDRLPTPRTAAAPEAAARDAPTGEHTSNHIVRSILGYLQERNLQPGDRPPSERALAERLGVGRNALREALATLTTLRVVEARPNSGIYLRRVSTESSFETLVLLADMGASPTPAEIAESLEVRGALEQMAVRLACTRRDDADLKRIAANIERTERVLKEGGNISDDDTDFISRSSARRTTACWCGFSIRSIA